MKKIMVVGATGTLGSAVVQLLEERADVIPVAHSTGKYQMDVGDTESIRRVLAEIGQIDAVVSVGAGPVVFKPASEMSIADYRQSLQVKLLGQIDLTLQAIPYLNEGGSVTLTTGILNHDFIPMGSAAAMVNNAVEGFVQSASLELPRGIRLNVVSPALLAESLDKYADFFPGFETVAANKVAQAYRKSIDGIRNGHVFKVS